MVNEKKRRRAIVIRSLARAARHIERASNICERANPNLKQCARQVVNAVSMLVRASKNESDRPRARKMKRAAHALLAYQHTIKQLKTSDRRLRTYFSGKRKSLCKAIKNLDAYSNASKGEKKKWCAPKNLYGKAAQLYDKVYQDLIGLGVDQLHAYFLLEFFSAMKERLIWTQRVADADLKTSYPPTLKQVRAYFGKLQTKPHDEVADAYTKYAKAFFKHSFPDFAVITPPDDEDAAVVYKPAFTRLDPDGRRLADCDGYSRLGRDLFQKAGYVHDYYVWRAMIPSNYKWGDPIDDVHSIAGLHRGTDTAVITNEDVEKREAEGFKGIQWDNPRGRPFDGRDQSSPDARRRHPLKLMRAENQMVRLVCRAYIGQNRQRECDPFPKRTRKKLGLRRMR